MTQAQSRRIGATFGAVIAGFATTFVLSVAIDALLRATGVYPPQGARMSDPLFVLATTYRILSTIAGGWVTARLAPARPMRLAMILGAIGSLAALGGVAMSLAHPELGPLWYAVGLFVTALPSVWAGAWLRVRQLGSSGATGALG